MAAQLIQATLHLYLDCAVKAAKGLYRNWVLIVGALFSFIVLVISASVVLRLGQIGGFILGIIFSFFISLLLSWISDTSRKDRLRWSSLWQFDSDLFVKVINVGFFLFLIRFVGSKLINGVNADAIWLLFAVLIAILFNCVAEVVYTHRFDGMTALRHSINFVKENWIEWFIPNLILIAPFVGVGTYFLFFTPLFPPAPILLPWILGQGIHGITSAGLEPTFTSLFTGLLLLIYSLWFMLFRAHLFIALDTSSRRQRIFNYKK